MLQSIQGSQVLEKQLVCQSEESMALASGSGEVLPDTGLSSDQAPPGNACLGPGVDFASVLASGQSQHVPAPAVQSAVGEESHMPRLCAVSFPFGVWFRIFSGSHDGR